MNKHLYLSVSFLTDTQYLWVAPDIAQISGFEHQINPVFSSQTRPIKRNEIKALFISSFSTSVKYVFGRTTSFIILANQNANAIKCICLIHEQKSHF